LGSFRLRCYISERVRDRKSYMGFQLQQKLLTLSDLERQFTAVLSVLCVL